MTLGVSQVNILAQFETWRNVPRHKYGMITSEIKVFTYQTLRFDGYRGPTHRTLALSDWKTRLNPDCVDHCLYPTNSVECSWWFHLGRLFVLLSDFWSFLDQVLCKTRLAIIPEFLDSWRELSTVFIPSSKKKIYIPIQILRQFQSSDIRDELHNFVPSWILLLRFSVPPSRYPGMYCVRTQEDSFDDWVSKVWDLVPNYTRMSISIQRHLDNL